MSEKILLNTKTCVLHITTGEASFFVVLKYRQQLNVLMSRYQTISFFVKYIINLNKNSMIGSSTLYLILKECFFFFTSHVYKLRDDCIRKKGIEASK